MNNTVKGIQTFIKGYVKDTRKAWVARNTKAMSKNWNKYLVDKNVHMIRPSGNPMTLKDELSNFLVFFFFCLRINLALRVLDMIYSKNVDIKSGGLKSIDSIRIFADQKAAVVTLTCHDKFEYKGIQNDDIAKFSVVLEKIGDNWKMVHGHRATGQNPTN